MAIPFDVDIPFIRLLGIELLRMEGGEAELRFDPRPEHLNSFAVLHGGAVMTLMDVTLAHAARSVSPELGAVTVEMKTSFLQPCRGPLTALGRILHRTGSTAFVEGSIHDAQGQLCAHATGTFRYVRRQPAQPSIPTD
ncbi:MAG TPA: PaaI family thioesterase [Ramlibacter sp.]|nr:PaaI family thioesterase [Ramlibacter sp.]